LKDWFSWIKNNKLRAAADYTLNGGVFEAEEAAKTVQLLCEESCEQIKNKVGDEFYSKYYPSKRCGGRWNSISPVGVVDHYTAGISERGTLRWFSNEPRGPKIKNSSAHAVINRDGVIYVVINPLEKIAYHATWANKDHVGIEHVNAGLLLRKTGEKFYYNSTRAYPEIRVPQIQETGDKLWEPYTSAQIVSNLVLKRWLLDALPTLEEGHFTEHADIDPDRKLDCGPLWPLFELNDLVFSRKCVRGMEWQKKKYLGLTDVKEFKEEINTYLGITAIVV